MMNQIIRAENYRIRKNKTFRIACIVIIGMVLVGFALFYAATHMISGELMEAAGGYDTDVDAFTDINLFDCAGIAVSLMQILSILYAIVITIAYKIERICISETAIPAQSNRFMSVNASTSVSYPPAASISSPDIICVAA